MNEHDDPQSRLAALMRNLPRGIEPARDLWPDVAARLNEPYRRDRSWERVLAAGIASLIVSALFIGFSHVNLERNARPLWAYQQLDTAYQPLRKASLERYRDSADRLDPELRRTIESNLAIIDGALTDIRRALASHPSDAALGQMLQRTYEQELAIIDAVTPPQKNAADQSRYRGAL